MKPNDVKTSTYIEVGIDNNDKDPTFEVCDHVRTCKYKTIFAKGYIPNWAENFLLLQKFKNTVPWTYVFSNLNGEKIVGTFYVKELKKKKKSNRV